MLIKNSNPEQVFYNIINAVNDITDILIIETDLKNLTDTFICDYSKFFPWHIKDSIRSLLTPEINTKYEFSYFQRIHTAFGINQLNALKKNIICGPRKALISTWHPKVDLENRRIPCLMNIYANKKGSQLDLTVIFRMRDLVKRLIPNWNALKIFQENLAEDLLLTAGKLTDISVNSFATKIDIQKIQPLLKINA